MVGRSIILIALFVCLGLIIFVILLYRFMHRQMRQLQENLLHESENREELSAYIERLLLEIRGENGKTAIFELLLSNICAQTGASSAAIYEQHDNTLVCVAEYGSYPLIPRHADGDNRSFSELLRSTRVQVGNGYIGEVAKNLRAELVFDPSQDFRFNDYQNYTDLGSVMATPISDEQVSHGVICAVGDHLSKECLTHMIALVPQAEIALKIAKAYEERSQKDRIQQELEFAHNLQLSLLPRKFPQWGMFSIDAETIPAKEVDGDFYDCIRIDDNRMLVLLGDACGKGVPACMLSAMTRSFARSMVDTFTTLSKFLADLNGKLYRDTEADRFITLGCCLLDRKNSLLEFGRAGHTDMVEFVHHHLRLFSPAGTALGILPDEIAEFDTICIATEPDTTVMLFSDGLTEALDKSGNEYGVKRLAESFRRACSDDLTLRGVIERVTGEVIATQQKQDDDQTIIVIRHTGSTTQDQQ